MGSSNSGCGLARERRRERERRGKAGSAEKETEAEVEGTAAGLALAGGGAACWLMAEGFFGGRIRQQLSLESLSWKKNGFLYVGEMNNREEKPVLELECESLICREGVGLGKVDGFATRGGYVWRLRFLLGSSIGTKAIPHFLPKKNSYVDVIDFCWIE